MEVAGCIFLLPQLIPHLLSTYIDLPHLSLNQSFSCFLQLIPSISSAVGPVTFSIHSCTIAIIKHLPQVVSKHDHTNSRHSPLPAYLLLPPIPTCVFYWLCVSLYLLNSAKSLYFDMFKRFVIQDSQLVVERLKSGFSPPSDKEFEDCTQPQQPQRNHSENGSEASPRPANQNKSANKKGGRWMFGRKKVCDCVPRLL